MSKSVQNQKGLSLIESLLVVAMVGIIVILLSNLPNALGLINKAGHLSLAREIALRQIENKRAVIFANLANGSSTITDSRISLLPGASGEVKVEDCNPQICTREESIKQVTVTVSWQDNNKNQTISLKTFIGEGGLNQ